LISGTAQLKVDFCTPMASDYACKNWHYSKRSPFGKNNKFGVWENGKYIGCIIYGYSATPNVAKGLGLLQNEIVELQRVALTKHISPVSKIVAISIKLLKKYSPGLKLIVSFADVDQNHHGGIYQAGNWIYTGISMENVKSGYIVRGKYMHCRSAGMKGRNTLEWVRMNLDPKAKNFITKGKHRYLMPLKKNIKQQYIKLSKPYPKRQPSETGSGNHPEKGGVDPTLALQPAKACQSG